MAISGISNPLSLITGANQQAAASPATGAAGGFAQVLANMAKSASDAQNQSAQLTAALASGQDVPMHDVVQAIGKAELTLQTLVTVRDKAVEVYQEIARMPI